nr:hypothetical protein [Tanacetum cinerariifolium]
LVRNVDSTSKFYMYPRFTQLLIRNQLGDLSTHTTKFTSPALTQKVFANMRRVGKGFSRVETPLFEGMLVAGVIVEEGDTEEQVHHVFDDAAAQGADTARIDTSKDTMMDDVSNQGRMIDDLDKDDVVALMDDKKEEKKEEEVAKRRKLNEEVKELKRNLEIVPNEDDEVYTEVTLLARKVPVVDYEIIHLNNKPHYKIIRADGTHQLTIHGQAKVKSQKLLDTCGVHIITFTTTQLILIVERRYPLLRFTLDQMLNAVRLRVEEQTEMSLELLRFTRQQHQEGQLE